MQMHISNTGNLNKSIIVDHTLIIKEIDRTIKIYNWQFILSFLPPGSIPGRWLYKRYNSV